MIDHGEWKVFFERSIAEDGVDNTLSYLSMLECMAASLPDQVTPPLSSDSVSSQAKTPERITSLSGAPLARALVLFTIIDTNNDGLLSVSEVIDFIRASVVPTLTNEQAEVQGTAFFNYLNVNKDRYVPASRLHI